MLSTRRRTIYHTARRRITAPLKTEPPCSSTVPFPPVRQISSSTSSTAVKKASKEMSPSASQKGTAQVWALWGSIAQRRIHLTETETTLPFLSSVQMAALRLIRVGVAGALVVPFEGRKNTIMRSGNTQTAGSLTAITTRSQ